MTPIWQRPFREPRSRGRRDAWRGRVIGCRGVDTGGVGGDAFFQQLGEAQAAGEASDDDHEVEGAEADGELVLFLGSWFRERDDEAFAPNFDDPADEVEEP